MCLQVCVRVCVRVCMCVCMCACVHSVSARTLVCVLQSRAPQNVVSATKLVGNAFEGGVDGAVAVYGGAKAYK